MTCDDIKKMAEMFLEDAKNGNGPIGDIHYIIAGLKGIRDNYGAFGQECDRLMAAGETDIRILENFGNGIRLVKDFNKWTIRSNFYAMDLSVYGSCVVEKSVMEYEVRRYFTSLLNRVTTHVNLKGKEETTQRFKTELSEDIFANMPKIKYTRFFGKLIPMGWEGKGEAGEAFSFAVEQCSDKTRFKVSIKFNPKRAFSWMDRDSVVCTLMNKSKVNVQDLYDVDQHAQTFELTIRNKYGIESALKNAIFEESFKMFTKAETLGDWELVQ